MNDKQRKEMNQTEQNSYSRIRSGELKRRPAGRTPNMSNPSALAKQPDLKIGSLPKTVEQSAVPVVGRHVDMPVRTVSATTKVPFPYAIVFLSLICAALMFFMIFNYVKINEKTIEISDLRADMQSLSLEKSALSDELDKKNDMSKIEAIVREEFGMVKREEIERQYIDLAGMK